MKVEIKKEYNKIEITIDSGNTLEPIEAKTMLEITNLTYEPIYKNRIRTSLLNDLKRELKKK